MRRPTGVMEERAVGAELGACSLNRGGLPHRDTTPSVETDCGEASQTVVPTRRGGGVEDFGVGDVGVLRIVKFPEAGKSETRT